jgi:hypothetical protein
VIVSTHVLRLLVGIAERALVLVDGRVAYDGALDAVASEAELERLAVGIAGDKNKQEASANGYVEPRVQPQTAPKPAAGVLRALWGEEVA